MLVKVCGMKYPDNIMEVVALQADYMGFIFYTKSKRYVGDDFVMPEIPDSINKVGVFVNEGLDNLIKKVQHYRLDYVQLHGDETPEYCRHAGNYATVIKAFGVDKDFNFSILNGYESVCDYFLFDTKTVGYGGSGQGFDRSLLQQYHLSKPYFLSGGIGLEELELLKSVHPVPFALDVNSKFEIEPALKDINKLKILKDELSGR